MFVRVKGEEPYRYLQIVENHREGKRVVQRVLCTLGRERDLKAYGHTSPLVHATPAILIVAGQQVYALSGH